MEDLDLNMMDDKFSCRRCQHTAGVIKHYDHPAGWKIKGYDQLQWVYYSCDKCKYQTSWDKLGVPR